MRTALHDHDRDMISTCDLLRSGALACARSCRNTRRVTLIAASFCVPLLGQLLLASCVLIAQRRLYLFMIGIIVETGVCGCAVASADALFCVFVRASFTVV
jgi:hypothetical protein